MELGEILRIIWRRLWLIALGTLLFSIVVFVVSKRMQPVYQARVTMMVNPSKNAPFVNQASILTGEELALTYSELLKARPLLEIVIANLSLSLSSEDLIEQVTTELIPGTQLLALTVEDTDAQRASDMANEIVLTFISLHNTEQQLQNIVALERDVVTQMEALKRLIESSQSELDRARFSSGGLLSGEESSAIQDTLTSQQLAYISLLETYLNVRLVQAQLLDITVVEPAVPPAVPVRPNVFIYTFLGAFVGFVFSLGVNFLIEYLDRSFETTDQIEQILSLPALAAIPRLQGKERRSKLVTLAWPFSFVCEAYRTLRTNIQLRIAVGQSSAPAGSPALKTLLIITSAEPGVDKDAAWDRLHPSLTTTLTANLGVVCAQAGLRVVLIDANLRFPELHRLFDAGARSDRGYRPDSHTGLIDLLVGDRSGGQTDRETSLEACMMTTLVENLYLIPGGRTHSDRTHKEATEVATTNATMKDTVLREPDSAGPGRRHAEWVSPAELLGSERMNTILAQVKEQADLILIGAPPVLAVTDTVVLASCDHVRQAGGVILAIEANRTSQQDARRAVEMIERAGATILGTVLTRVKTKRRGPAYGAVAYRFTKSWRRAVRGRQPRYAYRKVAEQEARSKKQEAKGRQLPGNQQLSSNQQPGERHV